ncbi:aspartate kinase [Pseudostreptobacillus hongkongensis]|uniref:aspartate kinase n=1 Tax=Pseudostreptobacillus hongkongensis TaxID=1162717 RepID=UPI00082F6B6D|nr:aspartate kinase [Pseudostreptobacillus hongkongensis]
MNKNIVVHKYGGSSVATTEKIINIAKHLIEVKKTGKDLVVVVSAMGKTTDGLIKLANEITNNPNKRELDRLMSTGEQQTIALLSIALMELGQDAISLTGEQAGIKTLGLHTKNTIESINNEVIMQHLKENKIVIVAGFQGVNEKGDITTLGRGGSDTSAVALACSLGAECRIYTDVDGVYTIDPRIYTNSKKIDYISYEEMMELAYLGAGVMEPRAVELGFKYGTEIFVGRTLGNEDGTVITFKERIMEKKEIRGISVNKNTLMVTIDNIPTYAKNLYPIFKKASEYGITIDMISQNDVIAENGSIAFTTPRSDEQSLNKMIKELDENYNVIINPNVVKVSLVGIGLATSYTTIAKVFEVLAKNNISFHQISTSEITISLVVEESIGNKVATLLAEKFEL